MRLLTLLALLTAFAQAPSSTLQAQDRWFTRDGHIRFYSHTPVEDIEANNHQVSSIVDFATGDMAFSMLMKGFEFEKALMEEHFNEKYVESATYPKAIFEGKIQDLTLDPNTSGKQEVTVTGTMTIHGVSREVTATGTLESNGSGEVRGQATFEISPEDYAIKIPGVVRDNIAKTLDITVKVVYKPLNK